MQTASSIVFFFLSPLNWILILLVAAYFFRKPLKRRICIILAVAVFVVFGNSFLLNQVVKSWQEPPVHSQPAQTYSCGIVLGGFASPDGGANGYFNTAADRFIQTAKMYHTGVIEHILISGGNGKTEVASFREAAFVKRELIAIGIPDSVIFTEDRSNNTKDNAHFSKMILDSLQLSPPYLLITSAMHLPRAKLLFEKSGVVVDPFPAHYTAGRGRISFSDFVPRVPTLVAWQPVLKEVVAVIWLQVKGSRLKV